MCESETIAKPFRSTAVVAPVCVALTLIGWQLGALVEGIAFVVFLPLPIVLAALRNRWWLPSLCAVAGFAGGKLELTGAIAGLVSANMMRGELLLQPIILALAYAAGVMVARFSPSRYYGWIAIALLPLAAVVDATMDDESARRSNVLASACVAGKVLVIDQFEIAVLRHDRGRLGITPCANATLTQREAHEQRIFENLIEIAQEKSCTNVRVVRKMSDFPLSPFVPMQLVGAPWICHERLN